MPGTLSEPPPTDEAPAAADPAPAPERLGKVLARRRPLLFAPLFVVAIALAFYERSRPPVAVASAAAALLALAWLLRIWATGYRTWVRGSGGVRHLMSAGPYAHVRHPLYVANGLAGGAALVLLGRVELLALYVPLYLAVMAAIVRREEETLTERYGDEHEGYRASVPRFVPRPGRSVPSDARSGSFSWRPVLSGLELWKLVGIAATATVFLVYCA